MDYSNSSNYNTANILYLVYFWMAAALGISFLVAYLGAFISPFKELIAQHYLAILTISSISQIALVIIISGFIQKLSFTQAIILFSLFSFLMGVTLTSIFNAYTFSSIITTLLVVTLMFGAMGFYGFITKTDLSRFSNIVNMALIGIIIAGVINIFWLNNIVDLVMSIIGVFLFSFLVALNIQRIKFLISKLDIDSENKNKTALLGALSLYLNFINLFLSLLRLTGDRKDRGQ